MEQNASPEQRRRSAASQLIIEGHIWGAVWYLAWPTVISTTILMAYNIINRAFLGRVTDATVALAAVTLGGSVLMVHAALMIGMSAGTSALVSRFLGAEAYDDADEATRQSLILCIVAGIVTAIPLILLAEPINAFIGARGDVLPLAVDYTIINLLFSAPVFLYFVGSSALRSAGEVRPTLWIGVVVVATNIILDWLLIFGVGVFPALGVRGAALATGISRVVGTAFTLWYIRRSDLKNSLCHFRPHMEWFRRILNIGWPASVQNLLWTTSAIVFLWILGNLPAAQVTLAQAAYGVALVIESAAFMPGVAYSIAAAPLVGQNLGAGKPERAEHSAWVATGQAIVIMSVIAVLFVAIPRQLAGLFVEGGPVISLIASYLIINSISEPFLAVSMVLRGALQGAGDTRVPAWVTFMTNWVIRLPLAWILAITLGMGAFGGWIAISGSTILSGILMAAWFRWGTWRSIRV